MRQKTTLYSGLTWASLMASIMAPEMAKADSSCADAKIKQEANGEPQLAQTDSGKPQSA